MDFIEEVVMQLNEGWFAFNKRSSEIKVNSDWEFAPGKTISEPLSLQTFTETLKVLNKSQFAEILEDCSRELPVKNFILKTKSRTFIINAQVARTNDFQVIGTFMNGSEIEKKLEKLIREKETAEYNDRLKSTFLANLAHDIRIPLTSISGFAEMMIEDDFSDDDKRGFARIIERNTENLVQIINDIIDVSKIESGQMELVKSVFNPEQLFLDMFNQYQGELERARKTDVSIKIELPENREILILADKLRLKQILIQLLDNAVKYTHTGTIRFGYKSGRGKEIEVFVRDTGIGIPKEKQDNIFRLFKKDEEIYTKPYGSNGLGLHIVKNIADLMGAGLNFSSVPHEGTSFSFALPVYDQTNSSLSKVRKSKIKKTISPWTNKKILVVDDIKEIYEYIRLSLRNSNVTCLYANSGDSAIKIIETISDIDLILMDIQMPGKSGIETLEELRAHKLSIPVIALTAFALTGDKEKFLEQGFNEYISKPIRQNDLFKTLKAFL
ncbi:hybrid sensor histidine kinase/response regulator [Saccharicrinis sp. FJH54]|uniref:ATP-binding response regulator n=1 Tax=Saccharicrinis sp. FJH54 TaxID=3344665 RepID=UPI0035D512BD